ncbi:MAG: TRAP transporter small permease [Gammaproteobacteria bacterium]|nr:TRAP transporter small permease [Gammaproteobacteria bacterium]
MSSIPLIKNLGVWGRRIENGLLVLLLTSMIFLASAQIFLRNFLDSGITIGDELLRILVLWLAILGALAASRDQRHIAIDALTRHLSPRLGMLAALFICVFVAVVCGFISHASFLFVRGAYIANESVLGGQPAWVFQAILPIGFGLMSWRYLTHAARSIRILLGKADSDDPV